MGMNEHSNVFMLTWKQHAMRKVYDSLELAIQTKMKEGRKKERK